MIEEKTLFELIQLYANYASVLDRGDWYEWPEFFEDECSYIVQPRENHERELPLATLYLKSKGMLKDRAYAVKETLFHDPYYQRHVIGMPRIINSKDGIIETETNYAVFRTKPSEMSTVYNVGRYLDKIKRTEDGLKFAAKKCIYDSEMIPNAMIYPI